MYKIKTISLILLLCMMHFALSTTQEDKWLEFKKTFHKKYESSTEELNRKKVFFDNLKEIEEHNKLFKEGKETFERNINSLSDMTINEIIKKRSIPLKDDPNFSKIPSRNITLRGPVPKEINWMKRGFNTPVVNQGLCGSCYAFGAAGALEAQYFLKYNKLIKVSEQFTLDCSRLYDNNGCNGGWPSNVFEYAKKYGLGLEKDYPYTNQETRCKRKPYAKYLKINGYNKVPVGNEEEMKKVIATIGPTTAVLHTGYPEFQKFKSDRVFYYPKCNPSLHDHVVLVVGYGTTRQGEDYWLLKNSWGEEWGDKGYMKLARNRGNHCGIANFAVYPINPQRI